MSEGEQPAKRKKQKAPPIESTPKPLPVELPSVKAARERIKKAIGSGSAPNVVGLALSVLAQEIGSYKAANQIIDDFNLTEAFGIQKIGTD